MAVNRIRGAFAAPRKGETFELRAGLVYVLRQRFELIGDMVANLLLIVHNMPMNGMKLRIPVKARFAKTKAEKRRYKRQSCP